VARRWAAKRRQKPSEAVLPPVEPGRRLAKPEPIPAGPAEHAVQFAQDWYDRLEFHSRRRMRELGIPGHRIGAYDIDDDFRHAAFHPKERTGGSNSPGAHQPQQRHSQPGPARPGASAGTRQLMGEMPASG